MVSYKCALDIASLIAPDAIEGNRPTDGRSGFVGERRHQPFFPNRSGATRLRSVRTGECHVRDSAWRGDGLDLVALFEALQPVPEAYASAEQNRHDHDVHVVDEPGGKEVAQQGGASADPYISAVSGLAGSLERLGGRSVDEVERRAALHLDRRARVMGEDEDRCVERRVGTPRAPPLRVLVPSGVAELPGPHDLGADPTIVPLEEGVVDAA